MRRKLNPLGIGSALLFAGLLALMTGQALVNSGNALAAVLVIGAPIALFLGIWFFSKFVEERQRLTHGDTFVNWSGVKKSGIILVVSSLMIAAGLSAYEWLPPLGIAGLGGGILLLRASLKV